MYDLIASAVKGVFSAAVEPVNEWQKRKTIESIHRHEIDKLEHQASIARANAAIKLAETGNVQDYDLDKISQKAMSKSWKDDFVLIELSIPFAMAFIPYFQDAALKGFEIIGKMPLWCVLLYIGMVVVIYGMRGMLSAYLSKGSKITGGK